MAIGYGVPVPKGKTIKQVKAKLDREDAKGLKAWRDVAWENQPGGHELDQWGFCGDCGRTVWRRRPFSHDNTGQCHHIISRRHKETRILAENCIILCRKCHNARHRREF